MSFLFGSTKTTNSSTTPTLTGSGQQLYDQLLNFGTGVLNNPSAGLQPIKTAAEENINSAYGNIPQIISKQMASRGYGSSGSFGNTMYQTQLGRLGSLSSLNGQMAQLASSRQFSAAGLMDQMLGQTGVGQSSTSKTTTMDPMQAFSALGTMLMMGDGFSGGAPSTSDLAALPNTGPGSVYLNPSSPANPMNPFYGWN